MTLVEARPGSGIAAALRTAPDGATRRFVAATIDAPVLDVAALVGAALAAGLETAAWLRPSDDLAFVGIGRAWATEPVGADRFEAAETAWSSVLGDLAAVMGGAVARGAGAAAGGGTGAGRAGATGPVLLGGMGFLGSRAPGDGPWSTFPAASMVLPELTYALRDGAATLALCVTADSAADRAPALEATWGALVAAVAAANPERPTVGEHAALAAQPWSTPDRAGWERLVGLMTGAVGRGRLDKVVLARRLDLELASAADPARTLRALAAGAPESATFLFARGGRLFVGATPERLARVDGQAFRTVAIAGSTRRGQDAAEDADLAAALLASDKDREEHAIVVDALRTDLAPVAAVLSVAGGPTVLALRDLQHLVTPIEGVLRDRAGLLTLAGRLHPTPAVGGAPTAAALAMLAEHEGFDRGWYAGPVGWVGLDGGGELMVALRSGVLDGPRVSLFAGCGIVADSDPSREWAESRMKLRPMLSALALDPADMEADA